MTLKNSNHNYADFLKTQSVWNLAPKHKRQRMLEQCNLDKNQYYPRAFGFLPSWVRDKLIGEHKASIEINSSKKTQPKCADYHARA